MPKWQINLDNRLLSEALRQDFQLEEPFGYSVDTTIAHVELPRKKQMLQKKLFQVATASKSQIPMNLFMFWMVGNSISIFTIFFIFQSLFGCITSLLTVGKVFQPYEGMGIPLGKYKLMFIGIQVALMGMVAYKLSSMGLLPVAAADYLDLVPIYQAVDVIAKGL